MKFEYLAVICEFVNLLYHLSRWALFLILFTGTGTPTCVCVCVFERNLIDLMAFTLLHKVADHVYGMCQN